MNRRLNLGPGLYRELSKADYLADPTETPSLSRSIAHTLVSRSPAHAWAAHPRGGNIRNGHTKATTEGTVIESLLLKSDEEFVYLPEMMANAKGTLVPTNDEYRLESAKQWRAAMEAAGKFPLQRDIMEACTNAAEMIRPRLEEQGVVFNGDSQVSGIWDEDNGVRCRMRLDHWKLADGVIYDLKKCRNAHPRAVQRTMIEDGLDIQAAAYTRGMERLVPGLAGRIQFVFVFVEIEPPFQVLVCKPAGSMRALGEHKWLKAVRTWGECLKTMEFPGYQLDGDIEAPPWSLAEMEESIAGGSSAPPF